MSKMEDKTLETLRRLNRFLEHYPDTLRLDRYRQTGEILTTPETRNPPASYQRMAESLETRKAEHPLFLLGAKLLKKYLTTGEEEDIWNLPAVERAEGKRLRAAQLQYKNDVAEAIAVEEWERRGRR
jgi:hypothetical protein